MEHLKQLEQAWREAVRHREDAWRRALDTRELAVNAHRLLVEACSTERAAASAYLVGAYKSTDAEDLDGRLVQVEPEADNG